MNIDMTQSNSFTTLFSALEKQAQQYSGELVQQWFEDSLFQTRSAYLVDYIAEARDNAERLNALHSESERYAWLAERLETQLTALSRALYRFKAPVSDNTEDIRTAGQRKTSTPTQTPKSDETSLSKLYATLTQYRSYETRLEDQLRLAQLDQTTSEAQARVIKAQQRVINCQKAIADIERKITKLEASLQPR